MDTQLLPLKLDLLGLCKDTLYWIKQPNNSWLLATLGILAIMAILITGASWISRRFPPQ